MNEELLRVILEFVKRGELSRGQIRRITKNASKVIKYLRNLGWIRKKRNMDAYKLSVDLDTITKELMSMIEEKKINVPFVCSVYSSKNAYMFSIPGYVVRSLSIKPGDLVVVNIDGMRISGTVVGKKRLFYIQKKYWDRLNIRDKKEINVVLEAVYRRVEDDRKTT